MTKLKTLSKNGNGLIRSVVLIIAGVSVWMYQIAGILDK